LNSIESLLFLLLFLLKFMAEAEKAERQITNFARKANMSLKGKVWMENCLDPFCDKERDVVGFPDNSNGRSYIKKIPLGFTYNNTSGGNEDLSAFIDTWAERQGIYAANWVVDGATTIKNQFVGYTSQTTSEIGGIQFRKGASGTNLTADTWLGSMGISADELKEGRCRIVGMGLEATNSTAEIYKGGAVIVYQDTQTELIESPAAIALGGRSWFDQKESYSPPTQSGQALAIAGAKTWPASKGAYLVARMEKPENPPKGSKPELVGMLDYFVQTTGIWQSNNYSAGTNFCYPTTSNFKTGFKPCGLFFSGLPTGTEITFRGLIYLEVFPYFGSINQSLSKPSVPMDIAAIESYSEVAKVLPAGVPVDENDFGDWLETIAQTLEDVGVPFAGIAKTAIKVGRKVISSYDQSKPTPPSVPPPVIQRQLQTIEREVVPKRKKRKAKRANKKKVKRNQMRDI
jgi:hypothetical protein